MSAGVEDWLDEVRDSAPAGLRLRTSSERVPTPTRVPLGLTRAVGEVLRNVVRHSGTTEAELRVRTEEHHDVTWLVVEVVDHGRGSSDLREGFGWTHSIRRSLDALGGVAEHLGTPGGGITVRLRIPLSVPSPGSALLPVVGAATAPGQIPLIHLITIPISAAWVWVALRNSFGMPHTALLLALAAVTAVATTGLGFRLQRAPITPRLVLAVMTASWAVQVLGLLLLPRGALLDYRSWTVGFAALGVMALCFYVSVPVGLACVASHVAIILVAARVEPALTDGAVPFGALNAVVSTPVIAIALGWVLRRTEEARERDRERLRRSGEVQALRQSLAEVSSTHLEHTRTQILPWLEQVADGVVPLDDPATARRARLYALEARDDLYAPGLLDPELRALVSRFRAGGGEVQLRPGGLDEQASRVGRAALRDLVPLLPPTSRVVVSGDPQRRQVRLSVVGPDDVEPTEVARLVGRVFPDVQTDAMRAVVRLPLGVPPAPDRGADA